MSRASECRVQTQIYACRIDSRCNSGQAGRHTRNLSGAIEFVWLPPESVMPMIRKRNSISLAISQPAAGTDTWHQTKSALVKVSRCQDRSLTDIRSFFYRYVSTGSPEQQTAAAARIPTRACAKLGSKSGPLFWAAPRLRQRPSPARPRI